jgi:hypothetical protein
VWVVWKEKGTCRTIQRHCMKLVCLYGWSRAFYGKEKIDLSVSLAMIMVATIVTRLLTHRDGADGSYNGSNEPA